MELMMNFKFLRHSTCGQETVVFTVDEKTSYTFIQTTNIPSIDDLAAALDALTEKRKSINLECIYEDMIYFEKSGSNSISRMYFEELTDHFHYPQLKVFNFSSNSYPRIPDQLKKWWKYFPALQTLDLSNNNIQNFSFEYPDVQQKALSINLMNNNITSVPEDLLSYLSGKTLLLINLLDNPIHCDCHAKVLAQYLNDLCQKARFCNISKVKCNSPPRFAGKEVRLLTDSELCLIRVY
ncbi:leucine-rich repeat-containing protein 24-like [Saccostrea echinata]|uniref:leucine-rich repeat-containing protein 24-like n=1 Tax=Saccostrea echinata TaxID=191078 RepID=UPI002A80B4B7|nr:leucine-rich repeat-containing protein 24-like [Saccostrea echinata]